MKDHHRILCVDDDADLRMWIGELFGDSLQVHFAASKAEAFTMLARERFDLILLDYDLGDGTGLELLQTLATDDRWLSARSTQVVMLTAAQEAHLYEACWDLGIAAWIPKPLDYDRMRAALDAALDA